MKLVIFNENKEEGLVVMGFLIFTCEFEKEYFGIVLGIKGIGLSVWD